MTDPNVSSCSGCTCHIRPVRLCSHCLGDCDCIRDMNGNLLTQHEIERLEAEDLDLG